MAQKAKQFIGNCQQDPIEYIEEILGQCSIFKQLTSLEVLHTYTCISCNNKSHQTDRRNILIQPLRKENETLTLNQILSRSSVSNSQKICDSCGLNRQHEISEEILIYPSVLIINLQRFKAITGENALQFKRTRKSLRLISKNKP